MTLYENKKVRITTSISDHCEPHEQGHSDKCLQITQVVFPNIAWQFMGRKDDRCVFEAYVEPCIAETYEQETG